MKQIAREVLQELFFYNPDTGVLTWKERPRHHFATSRAYGLWNTRFAGKQAGYLDSRGYRRIAIKGQYFRAHRIIWCLVYGEWPEVIDHEDGFPDDNRISKLRNVTQAANNKNAAQRNDNTSGVTGVTWRKDRRDWSAQIRVDGKQKHLGFFPTVLEASKVRKAAERQFGFHRNHGRSL